MKKQSHLVHSQDKKHDVPFLFKFLCCTSWVDVVLGLRCFTYCCFFVDAFDSPQLSEFLSYKKCPGHQKYLKIHGDFKNFIFWTSLSASHGNMDHHGLGDRRFSQKKKLKFEYLVLGHFIHQKMVLVIPKFEKCIFGFI